LLIASEQRQGSAHWINITEAGVGGFYSLV